MTTPQDPNDPYAPRPEEPAGEPTPPPYQPPYGGEPQPPVAPPYGQPPAAPPYGQPPAAPTYGQPPAAPPYGQPQPSGYPAPHAEMQPAYGAAPQYPAAGGYSQPPYGYGGPYPKNNLGLWALILGIASIVLSCGFLTGIPAVIFGRQGQRAADEGQANNRSMSTAGLVLGWVGIALSIIGIVLVVILVAIGGWASFTDSFQTS